MTNHQWFRLYHGLLDNPKIQTLPPPLFKHWINTLCVAKRHGGEIPALEQYAFAMRLPETTAKTVLDDLAKRKLVDVTDGVMRPHDWHELQYQVTAGAKRQQRYRERHSNADDDGASDAASDAEVALRDESQNHRRARARASDSVSVSVSASVSAEEQKKTGRNGNHSDEMKRETQELLCEQWKDFRAICDERQVLLGSDEDWSHAWFCWKTLSAEQKFTIIDDVGKRPLDHQGFDKMLPGTYLRNGWKRPLPPSRQAASRPLSRREEIKQRNLHGDQ